MERRLISIFTPIYNEEKNIPSVYGEVKRVMRELKDRYKYEHVFSNNSSTDNSLALLKNLNQIDKKVKIISLSKNFGYTKSVLNGYSRCNGDVVIHLDADIQDPPDMILDFINHWEKGYKVVYGIRKDRKEFWSLRITRKIFYRIANKIASDTLIPDVGDFKLIDRCIINELKKIKDYNPYLRGVIANLGFKQIGIPYTRLKRKHGKTTNNLFALIDFGINGIISHSNVLLRLSTFIGFFIAFTSFLLAFLYFILRIIFQDVPRGITSILIFILFFSGVQMIFLGIIGEYIARIFDQSIERPLVIEEELIGFEK